MAVSEVNYFSGGGDEDFYIQTATSNAEVKAWDGASFSSGVVTISLPFTPKYIMTYCQFGNNKYYNIYDATFTTSKFVRYTVNNSSITTNSTLTNLPNTGATAASWLSVVGTGQVQLLMFDTSTLTKALFMASA